MLSLEIYLGPHRRAILELKLGNNTRAVNEEIALFQLLPLERRASTRPSNM